MSITIKQREKSFQYIDKMVNSSLEETYNRHYEDFIKECPNCVVQYFNKNWHRIKNEWTNQYFLF